MNSLDFARYVGDLSKTPWITESRHVTGGGWLLHTPDSKEPELVAKLTEDPVCQHCNNPCHDVRAWLLRSFLELRESTFVFRLLQRSILAIEGQTGASAAPEEILMGDFYR